MFKLGLDIHGVIDTHFDKIKSLIELVRENDGEIHIITGSSITKDLEKELLSYNNGIKFWDYLVSIQDELIVSGMPILHYNEFGRPVFEDKYWDSFKGKYCNKNKIDVMIDDTLRYKKYFKNTIFLSL